MKGVGMILAAIVIICYTEVEGHYYGPLYNNQYIIPSHQYGFTRQSYAPQVSYNPNYNYKPTKIQAFKPISPLYDVEIIKPAVQMEEKKSLPLYVIPQTSLHIFPHTQINPLSYREAFQYFKPNGFDVSKFMSNPSHLPAIEIPLDEPMILQNPQCQVMAPAGFNAMIKSPYGTLQSFPFYTSVLLAPVPLGTVISPQTPVTINRIYALPKLTSYPSYYPVLTEYPVGNNAISGRPETINVQNKTITFQEDKTRKPIASYPTNLKEDSYPQHNELTNSETIVIEPGKNNFQSIDDLNQQVDMTGPDTSTRFPFVNSKESPYLQELRIESLRRQISDLQAQLNALRMIRN